MKWLLVLLLSVVLVACGEVGADNDSETTGGVTVPEATGPSSAELAYAFTRSAENVSEPFFAYDEARVTTTVEGECEYAFTLLDAATVEVEIELGTGFGPVQHSGNYTLPAKEYVVEALTNCAWRIDIVQINPATGQPFN